MSEILQSDNSVHHIPKTDNCYKNPYPISKIPTERQRQSVYKYAGAKLSDLVKNNQNLLIFPDKIDKTNEDGIGELPLFTIENGGIVFGNLVGFFGFDGLQFEIISRFDRSEKQHFFHYMLQKVFFPNVIDLKTELDHLEKMIDILPYLFPTYLLRALRQGIFRQYRYFEFNDDRLRGAVNVAEHIRRNIPFMGKIAYRTREYTANNSLIHLVRHTIEFLRNRTKTRRILSINQDVVNAVKLITDSTPDFSRRDLGKIIAQNLRPTRHPFYTEYTALQKLCLQILRGEQTSFGRSGDQVYGILFDAAWLWEEYLATVIVRSSKPMIHPQNKTFKNVLYAYKNKRKGMYIPDFYSTEDRIVLDAKYKHLDDANDNRIGGDLFQLVSYLHFLGSEYGGLIYPAKENEKKLYHPEGELKGYGGSLFTYGIRIPETETPEMFRNKMKQSEDGFIKFLNNQEYKYGIDTEN